jgi:Zn-finger nucleic acid-binding protein
MDCPRCRTRLEDARASERVCLTCAGRLLEPGAAEAEFERHVRLSRAELLELAGNFAGERLPCPHCGQQMRPLTLRSVPLDLCFGCGSVWFDAGELARLTGEVDREPPLPDAADPSAPTTAPQPASGDAVALVLTSDDAPPFDLLTAAFLTVGRTAIDARQWQSRNSGVLVESVQPEAAIRFRAALGEYRARVAAVPAEILHPLPQFDAPRLQLTDEGLTLYDHLDRGGLFAFDAIEAVAAFERRVSRRESNLVEERVRSGRGPDRTRLRHRVNEVNTSSVLLGLISGGRRVRVSSDRLTGHSTSERPAALLAIARELIARVAPGAIHPATRVALEANKPLPRVPSLQRLDLELAWLAWRSNA